MKIFPTVFAKKTSHLIPQMKFLPVNSAVVISSIFTEENFCYSFCSNKISCTLIDEYFPTIFSVKILFISIDENTFTIYSSSEKIYLFWYRKFPPTVPVLKRIIYFFPVDGSCCQKYFIIKTHTKDEFMSISQIK